MKKVSLIVIKKKNLVLGLAGFIVCLAAIIIFSGLLTDNDRSITATNENSSYVIFGMNDLGMHCYREDFSSFLILPPGNTIKVQVFKNEGKTAELVTSGIVLTYEIINNTESASKTNFWEYAKDYGYDVPPNIGITGNGLKGSLKLSADKKYYEVTFIPVTPFLDGSTKLEPYQMARITVKEANTGKVLAQTDKIVVPVSDEMSCSVCHGTENTDANILKAHDKLSKTNLVGDLAKGKRYKCSDCHKDNVLGMAGKPGVLPLSEAMHGFHADKMELSNITPLCSTCHPGPVTKCYRGRMFIAGITCYDPNCHGDMENIAKTQAEGREAWLQEPECSACHGAAYGANPDTLYRNSYLMNAPSKEMNGIIQCESCHNSPHAIWKSSLDKDNLLPISLQGFADYIKKCSVCHEGRGTVHQKPG